MKIEKINDNQIKCILNKNDLLMRNLDVSDFSYGTEKANELFREMTSKAYQKFGFEPDDIPLTIEAIPISDDSVEVIISKSEDPEELDTRFSKFSPTSDDVANAVKESLSAEETKLHKANEILNLLSSFRDALAGVAGGHSKPIIPVTETGEVISSPAILQPEEISVVFSFATIDNLIDLSKILTQKYKGESSVYQKDDKFYLLINNNAHTPEEFNQICNIICEYGEHTHLKKHLKPFLSEHYETVLENDALNELAQIS